MAWTTPRVARFFDATVAAMEQPRRLLFKNASWKKINDGRIEEELRKVPTEGTVQNIDRLMTVVLEAVHALTPRAKPSPYAKRWWWTLDFTQLRRVYTHWRNKTRSVRRAGCNAEELERTTKAAPKQYRDANRQQKKTH